jgi:hypothetical protein
MERRKRTHALHDHVPCPHGEGNAAVRDRSLPDTLQSAFLPYSPEECVEGEFSEVSSFLGVRDADPSGLLLTSLGGFAVHQLSRAKEENRGRTL